MEQNLNEIPIFFAVDDAYIPCLSVAIESLIQNSKKENKYICKTKQRKILV